MAEGDYNVKAIISAETSKFEKGMKNAQKSIDGVSKSISDVSNLLKTAFSVAGISISINTFINTLKSIDAEASESNKQLKLLSNTVKITGAATWTSSKQMNELAESISKNTNYSVNDVRKMETVLLGFKNITGETFTEASNAITDMATVMGMDLTSAVQTVGKALDDPISGLDSLRRQGFAFTDEQKKELEQLVKNGKQMQAQKIILDELATTYGGAAKQAANSGEQLKNNIKNLKAELGKSWDGSIEPIKKAANVLIERWTEAIKKINESKTAVENLKTVLSSAGGKGELSDAKSVQAGLNSQMFADYKELSKLADLRAMKLKDMSKAQKDAMYELTSYYDMYIQRFRADGVSELEAVELAREAKKAEWTQGLNDFQMIVEKEKELEKEREEAEKSAADEEIIARRKALTDAYDETIAKAKEEIKIRKSMGEAISKEKEQTELLEVMKSAYLKMIEDSNGEMKEETVRLQQIINLQKKLEKTTNNSFKVINADWNDFEQAIINIHNEIEEEASSWTDFFEDAFHSFGTLGKEAIESIGMALVDGGSAWENMGATALEMIAQILEALAAELAALVAVNYATWGFDKAAIAATGAAAALVAAGTLKGIASSMKKTSDSTKSATDALKELKETIDNISKSGASGQISDVASAYVQSVNAIKEARSVLLQNATNETYDIYTQSLQSYKTAINGLDESLKELNNTLDLQISAFKEIYSATNEVNKNIIKNKALSNLKEQLMSAYSDIEDIGKSVGELIINGVTEGMTTSTFLTNVKKYIINAMTKIAVFTESFQKQLADATSGMLVGITTGDNSIIENSTNAIKNLYETALSTANAIEGSITSIFNNIDTKTNSTVRSLKDTLNEVNKTGYTDLSTTLKFNAQITKNISSAYNAMKEAEKNYYSENIKATEKKKKELQETIKNLKNQLGELSIKEGGNPFNSLVSRLNLAKFNLENFKNVWKHFQFNLTTGEKVFDSFENFINSKTAKNLGFTDIYYARLYNINELESQIKNAKESISKLEKEYANVNVISTDALNQLNAATNIYNEALSKLNNSMKELSDNTKAQNEELDIQIQLYKELYSSTDPSFNSAVLETSLNKIKSAFYSLFEDLQDMGLTVGENLVNAIADGISQADFLSSMKDYIRKAIIQTVVYTETLQNEIAQIGATISKGIAEGFTDTGLHEIKRDLSYIFYMAQNSISKIDTVLDNVFSGYATGTQNATRGLHIVGEAGPELVRFRGGEQVLNASDTQKALSGTGTTINQNVTFNNLNDTSAFAMMQQFKRYNREMAINGIF